MGLLVVSGVLRIKQFWPEGRSDADTATLILSVQGTKPFVFVDGAGKRHPTRAFDNAEVVGQFGRKAVIKQTPNSTARTVRVRLQGLDAPELHYQPQVKGSAGVNHPFRQSLGETCANALHEFTSAFGQKEIPCEFLSTVGKPSDVCDVFGRLVGNIVLIEGDSRIDINHWLVREGWALPGFYNSMAKAEIVALFNDYEEAKKGDRGLFSKDFVSTRLAPFDPERRERKGPPSFKPFSDRGRVNFPKFFRRQAELHVRTAIGQNVPANLRDFIVTKKSDLAMPRVKFLNLTGPTIGNAAKAKFSKLSSFLGPNRFPTGPELVYFENDAKLVKAGTNTEIKEW